MTKRVLFVATGDTIAQQPRSSRIATGAELLGAVPREARPAKVTVEDVLAEPGWDTSPSTMFALARRARAALLDDGFDGVVCTHGIDTLEETAFLADLLAGPAAARGGIVFTGAARCFDDPAADGPGNLADSLAVAADPALRGAGAVVCAGGELHAARWATLTGTTRAAVFSSEPRPRLGLVRRGRAELTAAPPARPRPPAGEPESDVALIKTYPGMTPLLLSTAVDAGARGIVLEGTGAGNVPVELFTTISELIEWDIPVVIASRTREIPPDDPPLGARLAGKVGAIDARGLSPAHARSALMVALGGGGVDAVRAWFADL
ncbi:asparaginase [Amycolatopsis anabasis]|uniref:asparaginase n=1 Tax=Amycolatopsis anabasis TaxID=1840409 RepID=UPI00131AD62C|nr:asparaginase [Amycolatopsis anabasis]